MREEKEKENDRWERRAIEAKRESEVWEIINSERKKKSRINEGIEMEEWEEHFKRLLGGVENKVVRGYKRRRERVEEKEISKEEIRSTIRKMRDGKAAGLDGMPGEVWKYRGRGNDEMDMEFLQQSLEGGGVAGELERRRSSTCGEKKRK